jgi:formylglycine-generating enzyme required for sulfatase activity/tRNA A-37 threonylcarbamoyl transferase component Bud32
VTDGQPLRYLRHLLGFEEPPPRPQPDQHRLPEIGEALASRYELQEMLGQGAGAAVFRAHDRVLDLVVAAKVILPDGIYRSRDAAAAEVDLRAEARAAMHLAHPNIVHVYTYERDGAWEYLVMEYVEGESLSKFRRRFTNARLPLSKALEIGIGVLDALGAAHDHGVIHNDVKPANVMITKTGHVKVCDFGLARLGAPRGTTPTGLVAGSPVYMSPERIRGEPGDGRSDLYSLAATLFAILTGDAPFGSLATAALQGHLKNDVPHATDVPEAVDRVLQRALAKDPEDRFPHALAMRKALEECLAALWAPPRPAPLPSLPAADLEPLPPLPPPKPAPAPPPRDMVAVGDAQVDGVTVAPFWMERTPVTNEDFAAFVKATGETPPQHWPGLAPAPAARRLPVVGVGLAQARRYAAWKKRRLPTRAEWMAALRGRDGRVLPWGATSCDTTRCSCPRSGAVGLAPVDAHPDSATPEGVIGLLGNVWEWTEPGAGARLDDGVTVLGGSFKHACARPGAVPETTVSPEAQFLYLGFRCAADVEAR